MIRIKFEPIDGIGNRYRRHVFLVHSVDPVTDEITIPLYLYPGKQSPFDPDLYERPPEELSSIGQEVARLALGVSGFPALTELRRTGEPIRICIEESPPAAGAAAVPWELMHDGEEFLAANPKISIVRTSAETPEIRVIETRRPLRVLLFWSAPKDQAPVDVEMEQIRLALALAPYVLRREIEELEILHCTRRRLDEALATHDYDIVYFTGHGTHDDGVGYLCLEKEEDQTTDLLSATDFARKLAFQERPPALVFLNCCLSAAVERDRTLPGRFLDVGRRLLRDGVPFVVATLTSVFVSTAQLFMEAFLRTLLKSQHFDVPRAMAVARSAVLEEPGADRESRQTFYQFLLLTATSNEWTHRPRWETKSAQAPSRVLHASLNYPGAGPARVRRNQVITEVETAFLNGAQAVGIYGLGGLGKTVCSAQILERALTHTDPRLRVERALWLDLRVKEGLAGSLIEQLCDILHEVGERQVASALRTDPEPRPVTVARILSRALGESCLLTLDNCETLIDTGGQFADPAARDLVAALVGQTGWRSLFTACEKLSFAHGGHAPFAIVWLPVGELTYTERAALLRIGLSHSKVDFEALPETVQRLIVTEVAGHPYELNLFLGDARPDMDLRSLILTVHRRTGEYARLGYYVQRVPDEFRPVLWLLAALDEPTDTQILGVAWEAIGKSRGWTQNSGHLSAALVELTGRGLVEEREARYMVLPVLRSYLADSSATHTLDADALAALHRDLAELFDLLSKAVRERARGLLDKSTELGR